MNITEFRQQYPQYDDMDDVALATAFYEKYYSDLDKDDFMLKFGVTAATPPKEEMGLGETALRGTRAAAAEAVVMGAEAVASKAVTPPSLGMFSGMSGITKESESVEPPQDGGILDSTADYWRGVSQEDRAAMEAGRPEEFGVGMIAHDVAANIGPMIIGAVATAATRNPAVGYAIIGAVGGGSAFEDARAKGMSIDEAMQDAIVGGGAEIAGEVLFGPLRRIAAPQGKKFLKDFFAMMVEEGGSEVATEEINIFYDAIVRGENQGKAMAIAEKLGYAGLLGAIMGGGMAAVSAPFQDRAPAAPVEGAEAVSPETGPDLGGPDEFAYTADVTSQQAPAPVYIEGLEGDTYGRDTSQPTSVDPLQVDTGALNDAAKAAKERARQIDDEWQDDIDNVEKDRAKDEAWLEAKRAQAAFEEAAYLKGLANRGITGQEAQDKLAALQAAEGSDAAALRHAEENFQRHWGELPLQDQQLRQGDPTRRVMDELELEPIQPQGSEVLIENETVRTSKEEALRNWARAHEAASALSDEAYGDWVSFREQQDKAQREADAALEAARMADMERWSNQREPVLGNAATIDPEMERTLETTPPMQLPTEEGTPAGREAAKLSTYARPWLDVGVNPNNVPSSKEGKTGRWVVTGFDPRERRVFAESQRNSSLTSVTWILGEPIEAVEGHPVYSDATKSTDWKHAYGGAAERGKMSDVPSVPAPFFKEVSEAYEEALKRNDPTFDKTRSPYRDPRLEFAKSKRWADVLAETKAKARAQFDDWARGRDWLKTPEAYAEIELQAEEEARTNRKLNKQALEERFGYKLKPMDIEGLRLSEPDVITYATSEQQAAIKSGESLGEVIFQLLPDGGHRVLRVTPREDLTGYDVSVVSQHGVGYEGGALTEPYPLTTIAVDMATGKFAKKQAEDKAKDLRAELIGKKQAEREEKDAEAKRAEEEAAKAEQAEAERVEKLLNRWGPELYPYLKRAYEQRYGTLQTSPEWKKTGLKPSNQDLLRDYTPFEEEAAPKELGPEAAKAAFKMRLMDILAPVFETNVKGFDLLSQLQGQGVSPRMMRQTLEDLGLKFEDVQGMLTNMASGDPAFLGGASNIALTVNGQRQRAVAGKLIDQMVNSYMTAAEITDAVRFLGSVIMVGNPQLSENIDITAADLEAAYKTTERREVKLQQDVARASGGWSGFELRMAAQVNLSPRQIREAFDDFLVQQGVKESPEMQRAQELYDQRVDRAARAVIIAEDTAEQRKLEKRAPGWAKAQAQAREAEAREAHGKVPLEQRNREVRGWLVKAGKPSKDLGFDLDQKIAEIRRKVAEALPDEEAARDYLLVQRSSWLAKPDKMTAEGRARLEAWADALRSGRPRDVQDTAADTMEANRLAKELQYEEMWEQHWFEQQPAYTEDVADRLVEDELAGKERETAADLGYRGIPEDVINELRSERAERAAQMEELLSMLGQTSEVYLGTQPQTREEADVEAEGQAELSRRVDEARAKKAKTPLGEEIYRLSLSAKSEAEAKVKAGTTWEQSFYNAKFDSLDITKDGFEAQLPAGRQFKSRKKNKKGKVEVGPIIPFKLTTEKGAKYSKSERALLDKGKFSVALDPTQTKQQYYDENLKDFTQVGLPPKKDKTDTLDAGVLDLKATTAEDAAAFSAEISYDHLPRTVKDPVELKTGWLHYVWRKTKLYATATGGVPKFIRALADMARGRTNRRVNQARDAWAQAEVALRSAWGGKWDVKKDSAINHYLQGMDVDAVNQRTGHLIPEDATPHLDRIKRIVFELEQEGLRRGTFQEPNVVAAIVNARPYLTRLTKQGTLTREQVMQEMPGLEELWIKAFPPITLEQVQNAKSDELIHLLRTAFPLGERLTETVVDGTEYGKKKGEYRAIMLDNKVITLANQQGKALKDGAQVSEEELRRTVAGLLKEQNPYASLTSLLNNLLSPETFEGTAVGRGSTWSIRQARAFLKSEYEQIGGYAATLAKASKDKNVKDWMDTKGMDMRSRTAVEFLDTVDKKFPDLRNVTAQLRAEHELNWKIRDTINELVDPDTVISRTVDVIAENLEMSRFATETFHLLRAEGMASAINPGGWVPMAAEGSKLGRVNLVANLDAELNKGQRTPGTVKMSDIFVPPEVADAIALQTEYAKQEDGAFWAAMRRLSSISKVTKTVFSVLGIMRNMVSTSAIHLGTSATGANSVYFNTIGVTAAGKDLLGGFAGVRGRAWKARVQTPEEARLLQEADENGMFNDGGRSGAVYDLSRKGFGATNEKITKLHKFGRTWANIKFGFMNAFRLGDEGVKAAAMGIEASNYLKMKGENPKLAVDYIKNPESLSEEQTKLVKKAFAVGAEQVKNTYPTFSRIAEWMKKVSRFPLLSAFPGFHYEMGRNTYHVAATSSQLLQGKNYDGTKVENTAYAKTLAVQKIAGRTALMTSGIWGTKLIGAALLAQLDPDDEDQRDLMEAFNSPDGPEQQRRKRSWLPAWLQHSDVVVYNIDPEAGTFDSLNVSYLNPYGGYSDVVSHVWDTYKDALNAGSDSAKMESMRVGVDGVRQLFFGAEPFVGGVYERLTGKPSKRPKALDSRGWADGLDARLEAVVTAMGFSADTGNVFGGVSGALVEGFTPEVLPQTEQFGRAVLDLAGWFEEPEAANDAATQAMGVEMMDKIIGFAASTAFNTSGIRKRTHDLKTELPLALFYEKMEYGTTSSKFKERMAEAQTLDDDEFYELFSAENAIRKMQFTRIADRFAVAREEFGWSMRDLKDIEATFKTSGGNTFQEFYKGRYRPPYWKDINQTMKDKGYTSEERNNIARKYRTAYARWRTENRG